jgi:hypothetical protein
MLGGFLPEASAASYADLISFLIMAVEADGFNFPGIGSVPLRLWADRTTLCPVLASFF